MLVRIKNNFSRRAVYRQMLASIVDVVFFVILVGNDRKVTEIATFFSSQHQPLFTTDKKWYSQVFCQLCEQGFICLKKKRKKELTQLVDTGGRTVTLLAN